METLLAQKSRARKRQQEQSEQAKAEHGAAERPEGAAAGMPLYLQGGQAPLAPAPMASLAPAELFRQPKLSVNRLDDPYEREADQVAETVLRMPEPTFLHNGGIGLADGSRSVEGKKEEHPLAQRKIDSTSGVSGISVPHHFTQTIGPGQPLDPASRDFFEPRFGHDFSRVRVHTGDQAAKAAHSIHARAFTMGDDIIFGADQFAPENEEGRLLLAHELTHVRQQANAPRRTIQRKAPLGKGTDVGDKEELAEIEDVFAGKTYDTNTKEGVLAYAQDWHTQLLREYQQYMTPPYGKAPGDLGISFSKQQRTGRAFFIYTVYYWPELTKKAEKEPPINLFKTTTDAVNSAQKEAETEEASASRIPPSDYRTLFPETFAKDYDAESKKLREQALAGFDDHEKWKLAAAEKKDKGFFVLTGIVQYMYRFAADLHDKEAARIRKGQWDSLTFRDNRLFFWIDGQIKAEKVATAEYDKYVDRVEHPDPLWKEALQTKAQWQADLNKQNKGDKDSSAAEQDLGSLSIMASMMRNKVGREVLPAEVIDAWNAADQTMSVLRPAAAKGEVSTSSKENAQKVVKVFFSAFRTVVKSHDETKVIAKHRRVKITETSNPYFAPFAMTIALSNIGFANDKSGWKKAFGSYNDVVAGMDKYIAVQLEAKGRKNEGEQLQVLGWRERSLADVLEEHHGAQKVPAVFYPKNELENTGEPGSPSFAAKGIPLLFYIYHEDDDWHLADVTTPQQVKVTSGGGGDKTTPDQAIFSKVNSKLRFPYGRIYYTLPNGTSWVLETNEPWRASEWLTWIGLGIAAAALAIVTFGGSIPVSVIVIGAAVGVAAATADIVEKKRAGVLTTKDVLIDGLQIVASLLTAGSAKLGQVVLSRAAAAGMTAAEVGGLAGRLFVPVTLAALGGDVASFAVLTSDAIKTLDDIDKQPGSEQDRKLAKIRVLAQLIGAGIVTFLAVRGSLKAVSMKGLHVDVGPNGEMVTRPVLEDAELLKAAKGVGNADEMTKVLGNPGIDQELRNRIRAGLSEALTSGPVASRKLEELIGRLRAASKPEELSAIIAELNGRSRIGSICGPEVAARVTAKEAKLLANLDEATFTKLRDSSPRDLQAASSVLELDAKEGARLLREYGRDIVNYLRTNPLTSLGELEDILANQRARVTEKVGGLYEGIDTTKPPEGGWKFENGQGVYLDTDGVTKVIETKVRGPNGAEGVFERAYNPVTKKLELRRAFLRMRGAKKTLPSMVPKQGGEPEMVEGKGTPTVQYITLYQMKQLSVPLGEISAAGVKTIHMSNIQNVETIIHVHWLRQRFSGASFSELIEFTASMKYAETSAIQTGYRRSGPPSVSGGDQQEIRKLLGFQENGKPELIAKNKKLLDKYGFSRDTRMLMGFDIDFPVITKE